MTRLWGRFAALVVFTGLAAAAWASADRTGSAKKTEEKGAEKADMPRMEYRHTTRFNNPGIFKLEGEKGTADYVFNKQRHQDNLVFVRKSTVAGQDGWVYQVERDGKKQNLWFFFAARPMKTPTGQESYAMFFAVGSDGANQRQSWMPILPPTGTQATRLDSKLEKKDDQ